MKVTVKLNGFLQVITRTFDDEKQAEMWLRKIGRWDPHAFRTMIQK